MTQPNDCQHKDGSTASHSYVTCNKCRAIKTDSDKQDWGVAANKWFESVEVARFYQERGSLPASFYDAQPEADNQAVETIATNPRKAFISSPEIELHIKYWSDSIPPENRAEWAASLRLLARPQPEEGELPQAIKDGRKYSNHLLLSEQFEAHEIVQKLIDLLTPPPAQPEELVRLCDDVIARITTDIYDRLPTGTEITLARALRARLSPSVETEKDKAKARDDARLIAENAAPGVEATPRPGTPLAIIDAMFKFAIEECGHNPNSAKHALTTIQETIRALRQPSPVEALRLALLELTQPIGDGWLKCRVCTARWNSPELEAHHDFCFIPKAREALTPQPEKTRQESQCHFPHCNCDITDENLKAERERYRAGIRSGAHPPDESTQKEG